MRILVLVLGLLLLLGCEEDRKSDFADSVSGPGIEVNCLTPRPGVGNTRVDVICEPEAP